MKSMAWATDNSRRMMIAVHNAADPSDEEWGGFLEGIRKIGVLTGYRCIVHTRGGGPNGIQRRRLVNVMTGRNIPTAIMTSSIVTRGIATAISWFNPDLRVFGLDQRGAAFQYLKLSLEDAGVASNTIERLLIDLSAALIGG